MVLLWSTDRMLKYSLFSQCWMPVISSLFPRLVWRFSTISQFFRRTQHLPGRWLSRVEDRFNQIWRDLHVEQIKIYSWKCIFIQIINLQAIWLYIVCTCWFVALLQLNIIYVTGSWVNLPMKKPRRNGGCHTRIFYVHSTENHSCESEMSTRKTACFIFDI